MKIADAEVSLEVALSRLQNYAASHPKTLEIFDGLGDGGYVDGSPNEVTLADIGRLVVINAGLDADDVPLLLDVEAADAFADVPPAARLEDCEPGTPLWESASALYELFRRPNIGQAKRSKLLHAKRPGLMFISDSITGSMYKESAAANACQADYETRGYWEAARNDIVQDEFRDLMAQVETIRVPDLPGQPTLAPLSAVRVLDIVCWTS